MKKTLSVVVVGAVLALGGCGALEKDFNPDSYGPQLSVSSRKLPAYPFPDRFRFFDQNFVKKGQYKETGTGNVNDSRSVIYQSNENRILISEEIVGSRDQAEGILRYQTKLRGKTDADFKTYKNVEYTEGVDQKLNWAYLIMMNYDEESHRTRMIYVFINPSAENARKYRQKGAEYWIDQLLALEKKTN